MLVFVAANANFINGRYEGPGTPVADYRVGALINIPQAFTQPYAAVASAGCPITDRPTCGADGKTYQNECFLKLAGIAKAYDGWCIGGAAPGAVPAKEVDPLAETETSGFLRFGTPTTEKCPCNSNYYPVCGANGVTYANLCRAKCNGATAVQVGPCYNFYYKPLPNLTCKCPYPERPDLVCSTEGITYESNCVLNCAGATFKANDKCDAPCQCPFVYKPVCGVDGRNYINECELNCQKIQKAFDGRCDSGPVQKCIYCIGDLSKICGKDGKTYDNLCYLKCNKVDMDYQGACLPPSPAGACVCPKIYLPVCTTDNQTYDNECAARCDKKAIAYSGACKPASASNNNNHGIMMDSCLQGCAHLGSSPVCGTDGRTYGNACATKCSSVLVSVAQKKPCKVIVHDHCPCNTEYKPVCGVDGKTYLNICTIQCVGINKAWDGPCGVIGNYGYIMSQYYSAPTGAGAVIEIPKKKIRRHRRIAHKVVHISKEPVMSAPVMDKKDDGKWETQTIKVIYNTGSKDEKRVIVGNEN